MTCASNDTLAQRFWAKVDKAGECWLWTGNTNHFGYGQILTMSGQTGAHRVSYELNIGPIPKGMCVLHGCDNPPCVNPSHLSLGTTADNVRDRMSRGRHKCHAGEQHANSILTEESVRAIRSSALSLGDLSEVFGVSKSAISKIRTRKAWKHI